jgi:hypothetical protein
MHELSHAERVTDEFVANAAKRLAIVLKPEETVLMRRVVLGIFTQNIVAYRPQTVLTVKIPKDSSKLCAWIEIQDHLYSLGLMQIRIMARIAKFDYECQQDLQRVLALIFHAVRV